MASDLKIEIFAYKWFHRNVLDSEVSLEYDVLKVYEDEYSANPECVQASESTYLYEAIGIRLWLFQKLYLEEIQTQINEFRHSENDFHYYVLRTCKRDDLFGNLRIFDRVFATCAFVCCLCSYCYKNGYAEIMRYGYICWAIYFDNFTDEFYKLGGWARLEMVAASYKPPIDFLGIGKLKENVDITLIKIRKVISSYSLFKKIGEMDHDKSISMSWVKFYILNLNGSCNNEFDQFTDKSHSNHIKHYSEVEVILKHLKYLCDPNASEVIKIVGRKSTTDSLDASSNLNICDKYGNLDSKETILTSELKQNTTFANLASKSPKKLNVVEKNVLPCRSPHRAAPANSEISPKQKSLIETRSVSKADDIKTEYSELKSQDQDINTTISNFKSEKGVKRNRSLIGETPIKTKHANKRSNKKNQDDARKNHNELENLKEITIATKRKDIEKNSNVIWDNAEKQQGDWKILGSKKQKTLSSVKEVNRNETADNIREKQNELKEEKGENNTILTGEKVRKENYKIKNIIPKEDDERKDTTYTMKSANFTEQKPPSKKNTEMESIREEQKDEKKKKVLIGQIISAGKNDRKNSNKTRDDTRKEQTCLIETRPPTKQNAEKENNNNTLDDVRKERKVLKGAKKVTIPREAKNTGKEKASKIECKTRQAHSEMKNTILIEEISSRKNAEEENGKTRNGMRIEQKDGDVKNFLRMLLVLGDKEGISYVNNTSQFDYEEFNA